MLVVDDDPSIRQLLSVLLTTEGHEVSQAEDGQAAIEAFDQDDSIDLLVLDVMMPRADGYQVLEHVREGERNPDVAIVMLTAKSTKEDEAKAQRLGSDGYVTKPFDPDMLLSLIDVTLMYSPGARAEARRERKGAYLPEIGDTPGDLIG